MHYNNYTMCLNTPYKGIPSAGSHGRASFLQNLKLNIFTDDKDSIEATLFGLKVYF